MDYTGRNEAAGQFYHDGEGQSMQTATTATTRAERSLHEAGAFTRRVGHTTYRVGVHFSGTSRETMDDKIVRLVRSEAATK